MTDEPSRTPDLKALWRAQPQERPPASLQDIRKQALAFQRRKRIGNAIEYVAAVVVIITYGFYLRFLPGLLIKIGSASAIAWALFYIWQRHRLMAARPVPEDAAACFDFHRSELVRQRDVLRRAWRWALAPVVPTLTLIALGAWLRIPSSGGYGWVRLLSLLIYFAMAEFCVLAALWMQHRADKVQDSIDDLDVAGSDEP